MVIGTLDRSDVWPRTPWVAGHVWSESFLSWTSIKALLTPSARDLLVHLRSAKTFYHIQKSGGKIGGQAWNFRACRLPFSFRIFRILLVGTGTMSAWKNLSVLAKIKTWRVFFATEKAEKKRKQTKACKKNKAIWKTLRISTLNMRKNNLMERKHFTLF